VVRVNRVNQVTVRRSHSLPVRKFYMANSFSSVNRFGLFVNYLVNQTSSSCKKKRNFSLVDKLLTLSDLDPIRRYLPPCDRPKPNSRYSSIQDSMRYQYTINIPKSITTDSTKKQSTGTILSNVNRNK